jgi:A/G-specific adenine glycosylase
MIADPSRLASALVAWYSANARVLPWREDPQPYKVLLSELMLQQTRVETVIPYFHKFVDRWPTLPDLAAADEDEVLEAWAGLGYYSRARNLHRCARAAVSGLPSDPADLRGLPGIGPYTAGAIASIAFGVRAPLIDGNVERVLSRIDAREADPRSTAGKKALWERAGDLHGAFGGHPGDLNQALMELGATICTPRNPLCRECPVAEVCAGRKFGIHLELPRKAKKKAPKPVFGVAGLLERDGRVLLGKRPKGGLLGGLWEPVGADILASDDPRESLRQAFLRRSGIRVEIGELQGEVVHVFTHRRLTCRVYAIGAFAGEVRVGDGYDDVRWSRDGEGLALSRLARKILALRRPAQLGLPLEHRS